MDEISQVRDLLDGVPAPDGARKAQARAELLALAEEEHRARAGQRAPALGGAGWWATLRRLLAGAPRPALVAAAALVVAVGAAAVIFGPLQQRQAEHLFRRPRR